MTEFEPSSKANFLPKKKFGQNFLVNPDIKIKLFKFLKVLIEQNPGKSILEIGPGQGDLTEFLVKQGRKVVALEIDEEAVGFLQSKFADDGNLKIVLKDALALFEEVIRGSDTALPPRPSGTPLEGNFGLPDEFVLVSNLPFNVGSRILVDLPIVFPSTHFGVILQKEVALKTTSHDDFLLFGTWVNLFFETKVGFDLPPYSFYPQPRVVSAFLSGAPKFTSQNLPEYLDSIAKRKAALNILKRLFANPRKTLSSNLKNIGWDKSKVERFLKNYEYDEKIRLNWDNYEIILERVIIFV